MTDIQNDMSEDQSLSLFTLLGGVIGTFGVLFFWVIGWGLLLRDEPTQLVLLDLSPTMLLLYNLFPALAIVSVIAGGLLFWLGRLQAAVFFAGLPVVAAVAYYLALVMSQFV